MCVCVFGNWWLQIGAIICMYIYVCIISANVVTNIFSKLMAFYVGIMNYSMYVDMCEIVINFKGSEKGEVGERGGQGK